MNSIKATNPPLPRPFDGHLILLAIEHIGRTPPSLDALTTSMANHRASCSRDGQLLKRKSLQEGQTSAGDSGDKPEPPSPTRKKGALREERRPSRVSP